jgi:hypothetical protein
MPWAAPRSSTAISSAGVILDAAGLTALLADTRFSSSLAGAKQRSQEALLCSEPERSNLACGALVLRV